MLSTSLVVPLRAMPVIVRLPVRVPGFFGGQHPLDETLVRRTVHPAAGIALTLAEETFLTVLRHDPNPLVHPAHHETSCLGVTHHAETARLISYPAT